MMDDDDLALTLLNYFASQVFFFCCFFANNTRKSITSGANEFPERQKDRERERQKEMGNLRLLFFIIMTRNWVSHSLSLSLRICINNYYSSER